MLGLKKANKGEFLLLLILARNRSIEVLKRLRSLLSLDASVLEVAASLRVIVREVSRLRSGGRRHDIVCGGLTRKRTRLMSRDVATYDFFYIQDREGVSCGRALSNGCKHCEAPIA